MQHADMVVGIVNGGGVPDRSCRRQSGNFSILLDVDASHKPTGVSSNEAGSAIRMGSGNYCRTGGQNLADARTLSRLRCIAPGGKAPESTPILMRSIKMPVRRFT